MVTIETIKNGPYIVKGRSGANRRRRKQVPGRTADGALSLRRIDGKTVLRRHPLQDWIQGRRESRSRIEGVNAPLRHLYLLADLCERARFRAARSENDESGCCARVRRAGSAEAR